MRTDELFSYLMEKQTSSSFPENLPSGWRKLLAPEASQPYFKSLTRFLVTEYKLKRPIFPPRQWVLRALQKVDYDGVKVLILGQDPYHGAGQAIGLSFGVPNELFPKPPSLLNIFKEMRSDLGLEIPAGESDLTGWAEQGVLLLNTVLTVRQGQAFSHQSQGWEQFTDRVIQLLNERADPVIFLLWGAAAQRKKALVTNHRHIILESAHPSPLSAHRGFLGSRPFSKINDILTRKLGQAPINWTRVSAQEASATLSSAGALTRLSGV
jgi:uracil-DNA glycosylase